MKGGDITAQQSGNDAASLGLNSSDKISQVIKAQLFKPTALHQAILNY